MKTSDSQEPWVRIPPSPPYHYTEFNTENFKFAHLENYSRGRRGAPAKGVGWVTAARVQIPHSPPGKRDIARCLFCVICTILKSVGRHCRRVTGPLTVTDAGIAEKKLRAVRKAFIPSQIATMTIRSCSIFHFYLKIITNAQKRLCGYIVSFIFIKIFPDR